MSNLKQTISIKQRRTYDVFREVENKTEYIGEINEITENYPKISKVYFAPSNINNLSEDDCYNLSLALQDLNNNIKKRPTCEHCRSIGSVVALYEGVKEIVPCPKCAIIE